MALIKCPECGKEISDRASTCPNCGCPVKADVSNVDNSAKDTNNTDANQISETNNKNKIPMIIGAFIAVVVLVILAIILFPKKDKDEKVATEASTEDNNQIVYDEAIKLIESGDYEGAKAKFETIKDYKDVSTILDQISWETRTFACVEKLKDMLKSPDSLKIYDVVIFSKEQRDDSKLDQDMIDSFKNVFDPDEEAPVIVVYYGGQNTMGGMTDQITIFVMDKQTHEYVAFGNTKTLNKDEAKDDEEDVVFLYDTMNENFKRIGDVYIDTMAFIQMLK